uniref:Uncharacterized protein n=1 Tax=Arundo donax TaxID=35708 RepID=A0A0A9EQE1_ARUDO
MTFLLHIFLCGPLMIY